MARVVCLLLLVALTAVPEAVFAQDAKYRAPRTDDGRPDLQGVWNFSSGVPLQRPDAFADRKTVTREEWDKQRASVRNALGMIAKFAPVEAIGLDWLDDSTPIEDLRTSLITYPENGRLPAVVKGVRRMPTFDDILTALSSGNLQTLLPLFAAFGGGPKNSYTDFMPSERCLFDLDVPFVPQLDGNFVQIVQGRDHVVLITDFSRRIIALDGRPAAGDQLRTWVGASRGRWEGETLVVETRNFNDRLPSFAGAGTSRDKVVTERFTRTADDRIEYAATVVDPKTFMDRIELSFPMAQAADARIFEMACHEGNYSMRNSLAAARKEDAEGIRPDPTRPRQQVTVFDRTGAVVARPGEPGTYTQPAFSPDASQIAVIKTDDKTGNRDVWMLDVATGNGRPLSSDAAVDSAPVWSPDGKSIVYSSVRKNNMPSLVRRAADGTGGEEVLYEHDTTNALILTDWSRDGRFVTFWPNQGMFILPLTGDRKPIAIDDGRGGRFSPDGRLFAYNAADAKQPGRFHVVVRPFDPSAAATAAAAPVQVSQANAIGGIAWRSDSREMYFLSQPPPAQTVMAVDVQPSGSASTARVLFQLPPGVGAPAQLSNVASPDGQRFVFTVTVPPAPAATK